MAGDMTTPPSVNKPTLKTKDIIQKSFFYINSTKWGTMAVEHMNGRERERERGGGREGPCVWKVIAQGIQKCKANTQQYPNGEI